MSELEEFIDILKKRDFINIDVSKNPREVLFEKEVRFIVGNESTEYHREAFTESVIVFSSEGVFKEAVIRLPTVPKEKYQVISDEIEPRIPESHVLCKDGRAMSSNIYGVYTPHILSRSEHSISTEDFVKTMDCCSEWIEVKNKLNEKSKHLS